MSRFGYNLRQAFIQMGRNKGMYFTTIMGITAMMLILGIFFTAFVNVNIFARQVGKDYNVIQVYIKDSAGAEERKAAGKALEATEGVEKVEFVSKDEALKVLKDKWGDNGYLLESMPENPLPDSYNVYVSDNDKADEIASAAEHMSQVDDVVYYRDTIEKLSKISEFIETSSVVAMAFLIIVSIIIVANTIKLTVFNREKEIGIMKYLGATDHFVRAPFVWGGIIVGVISAFLATSLTYLIYAKVVELIGGDVSRILSVSVVEPAQLMKVLIAGFLCIGIVIGSIGSMISIRRFLDK